MNKMIIKSSAMPNIARRIVAVAVAILLLPGVTLVAQARSTAQTLSNGLGKNVAAEQLITREPRQDAPSETDGVFPVTSDCDDGLSAICECTRAINCEVRRIRRELGRDCAQVDQSADDVIDGDDKTDGEKVKRSIVSYLKTILAELRGEVVQATDSEPCGDECSEDTANGDSSSN